MVDNITKIQQLINELNSMSNAVITAGEALISNSEEHWDLSLREKLGSPLPVLTPKHLAEIPRVLASRLRDIGNPEFSEKDEEIFDETIHFLEELRESTVPNMFQKLSESSQHFIASSMPLHAFAYISTMLSIEYRLEPFIGLQHLESADLIPAKMKNKLRSFKATMTQIEPDFATLKEKIESITKGYAAAEALPATLNDLSEANVQISSLQETAKDQSSKISWTLEKSVEHEKNMTENLDKTKKLLKDANDLLETSTNAALGGAFQAQAKALRISIRWWIGILIGALLGLGYLANLRFETIPALKDLNEITWRAMFIQLSVSLAFFGAPFWLAWMATKQIKQLFKLQQDYEYKAATATTYEGYKNAAKDIGEELSQRLFNSAIDRLEKDPILLLDQDNHGSPWSETFKAIFSNDKQSTEKPKEKVKAATRKGFRSTKSNTRTTNLP